METAPPVLARVRADAPGERICEACALPGRAILMHSSANSVARAFLAATTALSPQFSSAYFAALS